MKRPRSGASLHRTSCQSSFVAVSSTRATSAMDPELADARGNVVHHLHLEDDVATRHVDANEARIALHHLDVPLGAAGERLDRTLRPQREARAVVHEEVETVGEPVVEISARGRRPTGQVELGLDRRQPGEEGVLHRVHAREEEITIHRVDGRATRGAGGVRAARPRGNRARACVPRTERARATPASPSRAHGSRAGARSRGRARTRARGRPPMFDPGRPRRPDAYDAGFSARTIT